MPLNLPQRLPARIMSDRFVSYPTLAMVLVVKACLRLGVFISGYTPMRVGLLGQDRGSGDKFRMATEVLVIRFTSPSAPSLGDGPTLFAILRR